MQALSAIRHEKPTEVDAKAQPALDRISEAPRHNQYTPEAAQGAPENDLTRFHAREGVNPLTHAFSGKIAVHPGMGGTPATPEERAVFVRDAPGMELQGKTVAYINVPFCETHCLYCGFFANPYRVEHSAVYVDALIAEMEMWRNSRLLQSSPVHAVYLGGGTPTALEPADLKRLLLAARDILPVANDCEITVEGRVSNLSKERMEAALEGGANRFSLGVQSFNTAIRRSMGRRSSREELVEKLGALLAYDQAAVLVDLIYGFPNQSMEDWLEDIRIAQSLNLDGADCYQLNIYKSSLLAAAIEKGTLPAGPDTAGQGLMFAAGVQAMEQAFYKRLSISHWARTPRERNIYNQYVKGRANCLAFGPGCGGNIAGNFYFTQPKYEAWKQSVAAGEKPVAMMAKPAKHSPLFRNIAENMEQGRLEWQRLSDEYGLPLEKLLSPLLEQWERAGLIQRVTGAFVLPVAGQFWQVNLTQLLLEFLTQELKEN